MFKNEYDANNMGFQCAGNIRVVRVQNSSIGFLQLVKIATIIVVCAAVLKHFI